jgi:hypothetical protein
MQPPPPWPTAQTWQALTGRRLTHFSLIALALGTGLPTLGPTTELGQRRADRIIIIRPPIVWPYPQPIPAQETVRVEFDAQGTEWGAVYLDGRLIYRPHNFDRQKTLHLRPGGYRLEITGVVRSDLWASGYLDIGRDRSQIVVVRFSRSGGVAVSGSPYVWIPD